MAEYIAIQDLVVGGPVANQDHELVMEVDSDGGTRVLAFQVRGHEDGEDIAEFEIVGGDILQFFAAAERLRREVGL